MPESPPDSSSEHPYSPQEPCEHPAETIYTTLGGQPALYKPTLLNPIMSDNLILGSHIVVSAESNDQLLDNENMLGDTTNLLGFNHAPPAQLCEPQTLDNIVYTNLQNAPKKRKLSQDVTHVKSEPEAKITEHCSPSPPGPLAAALDEDYAASETCLSESQYQCIRFQPFQQNNWHVLCDQNLTELFVYVFFFLI